MAQHRPVDLKQSFPALEEQVLGRWRERDVFAQSLERRKGAEPWIFYEGPPTANGRPGSHHVLSRVFKDIFPRYKTMRGYYVERKGGWDCHGLPVEIGVEEELGISSKDEIENLVQGDKAASIAKFNAKCRESVFTYLEQWDRLTERIGFWIDLDAAYRTLDNDYIESVWWALSQIADRDLLYEGHKVVPYCPRCGTALSSHEVALGYRDVTDRSIYVRFPVTEAVGPAQVGDQLLVWTTTPWTLPSNVALALDPELNYVRARHNGEVVILAESLVARVLADGAEIEESFRGRDMVGTAYEPPFSYLDPPTGGHRVGGADFVSAEDGTGLVHMAPAFGEDDYQYGSSHELFHSPAELVATNPVRLDGTYDERMGELAGRFVKDADADLIADLKSRGRIFCELPYEHSYPHCWRCGTPLLYYAKPSWYIATTKVRDAMVRINRDEITWHPEHIKEGRFGKWLENNIDWAISRERYWGTPLPLWRCEDETHTYVIGSFAELERRSGAKIDDPHRPYVDDITFPCTAPGCSGEMRRVPEVIDVWFDSGAMPFAQDHGTSPEFANDSARFPADFICEALDQTRGWFYSLLAVSTLLFERAPYRNVVCLGLILDEHGQKMSKSKGNVVDPWEVIEKHGADAFRWYYFTSKQPWDGYRFSVGTVGESVRQFLLQLWNTYAFYVLYANVNDVSPQEIGSVEPTGLDRWALSRLAATVTEVTERLDDYDATFAGRAIQTFVDDLSNWYVRRSRRRFWDGDPVAFATLRHCLVTTAKLLAPFTPFIADEIYENLDGAEVSVHLCNFPTPEQAGERDEQLEFAMATARETVTLGLAARGQAKIKIRQPLQEAAVVATGREQAAIEHLAEIVREELNVKEIRFVSGAEELGSYEVKANYRTLGPRFGKQMPQAAAAVAALDAASVAAALERGEPAGISVEGTEHQLTAEDLQLAMQPLEGYQLEREGSHAVALDLTLTDELITEGQAREIVHAVQGARRDAGLEVEDRIELTLGGDADLIAAARSHEPYIADETLATAISYTDSANGSSTEIDGRELSIAVIKKG